MIPLVRPKLPDLLTVMTYMQKPIATGQVTNFGELFWEVVDKLHQMTDRWCLPVINGTAAIQIALQVVERPSRNVVLPDFTHVGTLCAVIAARMNPILTSVSRETWTLDLNTINGTKANTMIVVSPFGYGVDFSVYDRFADSKDLDIVYDLAGGWGLDVGDTPHPCCYSFHATKNFAIGEGGLISFKERHQFDRARKLTNFSIEPDGTIGCCRGGNYKLDEMRCAMILANLLHDPMKRERSFQKKIVLGRYYSELKEYIERPPIGGAPSMAVLPGVPSLEDKAAQYGIQMKRYYPLLSSQSWAGNFGRLAVSDRGYFKSCMAVPSDVSDDELGTVIYFMKENCK